MCERAESCLRMIEFHLLKIIYAATYKRICLFACLDLMKENATIMHTNMNYIICSITFRMSQTVVIECQWRFIDISSVIFGEDGKTELSAKLVKNVFSCEMKKEPRSIRTSFTLCANNCVLTQLCNVWRRKMLISDWHFSHSNRRSLHISCAAD